MSRPKVLALIDKDPTLLEICKRINERRERYQQRLAFLQKQADDEGKKMVEENDPDFRLIEARLAETGTTVNYDKETHHLAFSIESNVLELVENRPRRHPLEMIFGHLRGDD